MEFNFFGLLETWHEYRGKRIKVWPNYVDEKFEMFEVMGTRESKWGRVSGGIICGVNKEIRGKESKKGEFSVAIELNQEGKIWWVIFVYMVPKNTDLILNELRQFMNELEGRECLILGDLNGRIGELQSEVGTSLGLQRVSKDKIINMVGRHVISLCNDFGLVILNGCTDGDSEGEFTYVARNGSSVIDYALITENLWKEVADCKIGDQTVSDHFPVEIFLSGKKCDGEKFRGGRNKGEKKFIWAKENKGKFQEKVQKLLDEAVQMDIELKEVKNLTKIIQTAAESVKSETKTINGGGLHWFDTKCKEAISNRNKALWKMRKSNSGIDRVDFVEKRRIAKNICRAKKVSFFGELNKRGYYLKETKKFWGIINGLKKPTNIFGNKQKLITTDNWKNHFERNIGDTVEYVTDFSVFNGCKNWDDEILDREFNIEEINRALQNLKENKTPGKDNLQVEFWKNAGDDIKYRLCQIFNNIYDFGTYPSEWKESIIIPIHKKGDKGDVNNYRGISLTDAISKVFNTILLDRMRTFLMVNNVLDENQMGFRTGYSGIDCVFILNNIVQKQISKKNGKVYACFVDFKQAFDSLDRSELIKKLFKENFSYKFVSNLATAYEGTSAQVNVGELSESFFVTKGVKQGCVLSPTLFSIYINDLSKELNDKGGGGFIIDLENNVEVKLLCFADDVVILADSPQGLQRSLNVLNHYATQNYLTVNVNKTKVMIFQNGGRISKKFSWKLGGKEIEVVKEFVYLGVKVTYNGNFEKHLQGQKIKAMEANRKVLKICQKGKIRDVNVKFNLFDSLVKSIALYGSEVIDLSKCEKLDVVQTVFLKRGFRLFTGTHNCITYLQFGRLPLIFNVLKRCFNYIFRVSKMEQNRWVRKAMERGFNKGNNWSKEIINICDKYNYNIKEHFEKNNISKQDLEKILMDYGKDKWNQFVEETSTVNRCNWYKDLDMTCLPPYYLSRLPYIVGCVILGIRTGSLNWGLNKGMKVVCKYCHKTDIDIKHVVCNCEFYEVTRKEILDVTEIQENAFVKILDSTDSGQLWKLYGFIKEVVKRGKIDDLVWILGGAKKESV